MAAMRWTALTLLPALLIACGGGGASVRPTLPPLSVVVVGDSISKLEVLPSSTVPCSTAASPPCDYSSGYDAYPALIARQTGDRVLNLAQSGSLSIGDLTIDGVFVPGVSTVITHVPRNTDVVVWESGLNDIAFYGRGAPSRVPTVATRLKERVPNARVIVIGVRYFVGCIAPGNCTQAVIDAWDTREQKVAVANGWTFIDIRHLWPAGIGPDWPDGRHPGPLAIRELASLVESAIGASY